MQIDEFVPAEVTRYITFHRALNPKLWRGDDLRIEVRVKLLRSALQFYRFLDEPDLKIADVIMTGSNAAFNYTPLSDIDVHVVVDFEHAPCPDLADNFFSAKKSLWNQTRQISVRGHHLELYVEDVKNPVRANGIYSLLHGTWVTQPHPVQPSVFDPAVVAKTEQYADEIDNLLHSGASAEEVSEMMGRLRRLRQSGLTNGGEYSVENLTFKSLRNLGYLDRLAQQKLRSEDDDLSLA